MEVGYAVMKSQLIYYMLFVCLIAAILLVTVRVTAVPKAERRSITIVFQGMLSGILVDVFYDPYCAFREGILLKVKLVLQLRSRGKPGILQTANCRLLLSSMYQGQFDTIKSFLPSFI